MNLFGKKKEAPRVNDSIVLLRDALTTLEKRESHLEKQINSTLIEAKKKAVLKDKRGALFQLKRKKLFEKEIDQIYGKRINIETQINALESASSSADVLKAMVVGKDALNNLVQETNIEHIDDVMDEINESIGMVDEISAAMSQQIGPAQDESELEAELAAMEAELTDEALLGLDAPVKVPTKTVTTQQQYNFPSRDILLDAPSVPSSRPAIKVVKSKEDEELDALTAELGI